MFSFNWQLHQMRGNFMLMKYHLQSRLLILAPLLTSLLLCTPVSYASDPLIIGIFPRRNAAITIKYFTPLANYLEKKLGRRIMLETTRDFRSFWQGIKNRRYDIVHFNQFHYVQSRKQFGYEVILKNEEFGKQTIAGAIVIRKDSGIKTLSDLKGKRIMFGGGPKAMVAYIATTYLLRKAGLKKGDYREIFAKNPPNACMGTYLRQADAGGVGNITLELPVIKKRINTERLTFLATGESLPHILWAVKKNMPAKLKLKIQMILANLYKHPEGKAILDRAKLTRLVLARDTEFKRVRAMIKFVTGNSF